jgi:hypothetical protein
VVVSLPPITGTTPVPPSLSLYWLSVAPVPEYLAKAQAASNDPDADWMRQAETIQAARFNPRAHKNRYVPAIPMEFIGQTLIAGDALALLLVALAEMRMRGIREIAIGPGLWAQVGDPSKRVRVRLLRQIAQLPASVCTLTARNGRPHLLTAGAAWPKPFR